MKSPLSPWRSPVLVRRRLAPVIIDTDCGSDDLMAIAFLLGRKDVRIEAIAVDERFGPLCGLAHRTF